MALYSTFIGSKPKRALFETDLEIPVQSEEEFQYMKQHFKKCNYYYLGLAKCRDSILTRAVKGENDAKTYGFQPCKKIADSYWQCMTEKKIGTTIEEAPKVAQKQLDTFFTCSYISLDRMEICRTQIDNAVRLIYREKDTPLRNN